MSTRSGGSGDTSSSGSASREAAPVPAARCGARQRDPRRPGAAPGAPARTGRNLKCMWPAFQGKNLKGLFCASL